MLGNLSCLYFLIIVNIEEESHIFQMTLYNSKSFSLLLFHVPSETKLPAEYHTTF